MSLPIKIGPRFDSDLLAGDHFGDKQYRLCALKVANRIRKHLGLREADRLLPGYVGDSRWGNPVVFTVSAGEPLLAARFEEQHALIAVDSIDSVREYPLTRCSVVGEFIRRFDAGAYPDLNARKEV